MAGLRDIVDRMWKRTPAGSESVVGADSGGLFPADPATPVVLVTAFGVAAPALDAALDRALTGVTAHSRIVCLTDQPDFAPLRRRGVAFEYLPPPSARSATLGDAPTWQAYVTERYEILLAKWRPAQIVTAGDSVDHFLSGGGGAGRSSSASRNAAMTLP